MDSLKPNSHRLIYFMEEKKTLRALWCPWRLSGHACARRVKTVSNHLNPIPPGLFEGGAAWGGGGGWKVPAAYNSKTINDNEMKLGGVVKDH